MGEGGDGLVGGDAADRAAILALHHAYLVANATYDAAALEPVFSAREGATFYNLNGHTYRGLAQWRRLWAHYAPRVRSTYWAPRELGGVVDGDTAVVWCERTGRRRWVGEAPPVRDVAYDDAEFPSRSTMVFQREASGWRVVHAHFSRGEAGARPGGV